MFFSAVFYAKRPRCAARTLRTRGAAHMAAGFCMTADRALDMHNRVKCGWENLRYRDNIDMWRKVIIIEPWPEGGQPGNECLAVNKACGYWLQAVFLNGRFFNVRRYQTETVFRILEQHEL